jgi:dGTPase
MNKEIKAYHPQKITRISFNTNLHDPDLVFEKRVNPFEIDQNKILFSKAFRRESDKTQVFFNPSNPHIRNRSSHTHEVIAIANSIGHSLNLNTELIKASALGHDLGHGPAGHLFEKVSQDLGIKFRHERFSGIISSFIERNGNGLNLTKETLNGILDHSRGSGELVINKNSPNENLVVMYSDKIAYVFSDINDLKRLGWISLSEYKLIDSYFPGNQRDRVNQCIFALIQESFDKSRVSFSDSDIAQKFKKVKDIMYEHYSKINQKVLIKTIKTVYDCIDHITQLQKYDPTLIIALMTDKELSKLGSLSSQRTLKLDDLKNFGVFELIKNGFLASKTYADLDLKLRQKLN